MGLLVTVKKILAKANTVDGEDMCRTMIRKQRLVNTR